MKKSFSSLDPNLLLRLQLLMQGRSVIKTVKRMNATPSAVSKSPSKLRTWLDDPLSMSTPLGLSPTPLIVSMERSLAGWIQMGNQLLDKPHHESPCGPRPDLAVEMPLVMIMFNALPQQICQRYPQAIIKIRNWDYDSLSAIIHGEVDVGSTGCEGHPRSCELLSLLLLSIDHEALFPDLPYVWLRKDHPALWEEWNLNTLLRYPHISTNWEQSDTQTLDEVLQGMGCTRNTALRLPDFEQSLSMAAQPDRVLMATASIYYQRYN